MSKKTITKGAVKVPVIIQLEALECGAAALAMVMAYYDKWVPLEQLRSDCGISRDGSNAANIYRAAESYGFDVKAFTRSADSIRKKGRFPCIIHWNFNHFVVLNGFKGKYAYINDPARGFVKVGEEEFRRSFTGITIVPVPGKDFKPEGKRQSTIGFARKRLIGDSPCYAYHSHILAVRYNQSDNVQGLHGQASDRAEQRMAHTVYLHYVGTCVIADNRRMGAYDL